MKKNISVILAVVLLISSFSFVSAKDTNADYILADFSLGDETSFDFISDEGGTSHKNNITDTVKRYGKESSLKWDFAGGNKSLKVTKGTLGNFLDYDYFYAWIYSTSANNQPLVSLFRDHSIDKYVSNNSTVVCDYKGWKLHQIDISGYTLKSFTADAIAEHDFQFFFRNTGWGVTAIGDTVMYIDSIFLSNNDYLAAGEEIITTYFQNGATDVEATNLITLSASPAFKSDSQYYDDKVTVLKDGNALTDGYSIDFEYTKAYVQFDEVLESGAEYTIQFDENAVMSDGTVIGNKGTISFTIAEKELELGYTTIGPHRDDLVFKINDLDCKHYASQGQQRTVALVVKLSLMEVIKEEIGEYPILLLDDVLSELDSARQDRLLNLTTKYQTFISCTSIPNTNLNYNIKEVFDGQVIK